MHSHKFRPFRRGVSAVELLVVAAVVGASAAILAAATPVMRARSRLVACRSNLKQVGVALGAYHDAYQTFPPGAVWNDRQYGDPRLPCLPLLLPYLGRSDVADAVDWSATGNIWCSPQNANVVATPIDVLLCPADGGNPDAGGGRVKQNPYCGTQAVTNYMGFYGRQVGDVRTTVAVFGANRGARLKQLTDGGANTLAFGEYLTGTPRDLRGQLWADEAGASLLFFGLTPNSSAPDRLFPNPEIWDDLDATVNDAGRNLQFTYGDGFDTDTAAPRSRHAGGVHILTADGTVRFISDTVDPTAWNRLGVINVER